MVAQRSNGFAVKYAVKQGVREAVKQSKGVDMLLAYSRLKGMIESCKNCKEAVCMQCKR